MYNKIKKIAYIAALEFKDKFVPHLDADQRWP